MDVQRNLMSIKSHNLKFHVILWNFVTFHLAATEFHYSMEYSMEFHGTLVAFEMLPSKFNGIPWNSVIFDLATS